MRQHRWFLSAFDGRTRKTHRIPPWFNDSVSSPSSAGVYVAMHFHLAISYPYPIHSCPATWNTTPISTEAHGVVRFGFIPQNEQLKIGHERVLIIDDHGWSPPKNCQWADLVANFSTSLATSSCKKDLEKSGPQNHWNFHTTTMGHGFCCVIAHENSHVLKAGPSSLTITSRWNSSSIQGAALE